MDILGLAIEAIKKSEGHTRATMLKNMAQVALPEGHPDRLFFEWLHQWEGRIKEGVMSLGLELPAEGEGLLNRIREIVTPVLVERWQSEHQT